MMQACDNLQIQVPQLQEFSFDAAATALAFLAEGMLATGLGDGSLRLIAPGDGQTATTSATRCRYWRSFRGGKRTSWPSDRPAGCAPQPRAGRCGCSIGPAKWSERRRTTPAQ